MTQPHPKAFAIWFKDLDDWGIRISKSSGVLPSGWARKRISEIVDLIETKQAAKPKTTYTMTGVRWYGQGIFLREKVTGKEMSASYVYKVVPNALIYNRLFAWKGSFAVVPEDIGEQYVSNEFPQFLCKLDLVLPEYLFLICMTDGFNALVNQASTGSAAVSRNRLRESKFLNFEIVLPPLETQRAIVRRWQEGQAKVERLEALTRKMEEGIPKLIYNLLGTPHPSASQCLPKAYGLYWEDVERWSVGYIARAHIGLLGFVSFSFPIVPLENVLTETMNGYSIKPVALQTPYKMLKLNALGTAGLDMAQTKHVQVSEKVSEQFSLRKGDLLICRSVGSFDLVAKCAVVEANYQGTLFPDIIIRALFNSTVIPEYVREVMQTPLGRSHFQSNARTAVGMWKIGAEDIRSFPLPLPPLETQRNIVRQVQAVRSEAARLRVEAAKLRQDTKEEVERLILGTESVFGLV